MKYNDKNKAYYMSTPKEKLDMFYTYDTYFNSEWYDIDDAYINFSHAKYNAFHNELDIANNNYNRFYNAKVISKNTFIFTMGYLFEDVETGELNFMFITPTYRKYVHLSDLEAIDNSFSEKYF